DRPSRRASQVELSRTVALPGSRFLSKKYFYLEYTRGDESSLQTIAQRCAPATYLRGEATECSSKPSTFVIRCGARHHRSWAEPCSMCI
ncbi:MAG: hypothetical protein AB1473_23980, partial [Thermodesulfobacteriota bacterium]